MKIMKILFIGDSIIKGSQGVNFVKLVSKHFPTFQITNLGIDGESLNLISKRLLNHLKKVNDYDYIILEGGAGDIALPTFLEKGKLFEFAYRHQLKKGIIPLTNSADFHSFMNITIREVKGKFNGKLILLTLGCLNEKLDSKLNFKREEYNQVIKQLSKEQNILLADPGILVNDFLKAKTQNDFYYGNFWSVAYTDRIFTLFNRGARYLSKKRNLWLTIDGVHLNEKGAELFAQSIINLLEIEMQQLALR
jgi:lysophospholipase L1-like esterase